MYANYIIFLLHLLKCTLDWERSGPPLDQPMFHIFLVCPDDCLKQENCTYEDMGMFVGVPYFQLGYIAISSDVTDRFLMRLTLSFEMDKEQYLQEAMVIRKETEGMVCYHIAILRSKMVQW